MPEQGKPEEFTVLRLLTVTTDFFRKKEIPSPRLDAEVLLAAALETTRLKLYASHDRILSQAEVEKYRGFVRRRGLREPAAYILGEKEFYSLAFEVSPQVLVPRPETEHLVDEAVRWARARLSGAGDKALSVLDIGTGSGCIAISVAKNVATAQITAVDISQGAIEVARRNALRHKVDGRIAFLGGDLFAPVAGKKFDLILSNPPYIADGDAAVWPEARNYEPANALFAGKDGLDIYRRLASELEGFLAPGGCALLELGAEQSKVVAKLFGEAGFRHCESLPDFSGHARILRVARNAIDALAGKAAAKSASAESGDWVVVPENRGQPALIKEPDEEVAPKRKEKAEADSGDWQVVTDNSGEAAMLSELLDQYGSGGEEEPEEK